MASLTDIPPELLNPDKQTSFIRWLLEMPIDFGTRRAFIRLWTHETGATLTSGEWALIKSTPSL